MAKRPTRRTDRRTHPAPAPERQLPPHVMHLLFAGLVIVLLAIFYHEFLLRGSSPRTHDVVAADELVRMSVSYEETHGEMPLWTPAVFSGMPSYGSMIYIKDFIGLDILGRIIGLNLYWRLMVFFGLISAPCLYFLLTHYVKSRLAAFFGSVMYVFTPYFPGLINAGHNNKLWAAALIPPLLLVTDGLVRQRSVKAFAWFAFVAAWQLAVRHPQVTYYGFMFIGCIILADALVQEGGWFVRGKRLLGDAALVVGGVIVVLGVVALPYLSVLEYTPESVRGGTPSAGSELVQTAGGEATDQLWDYATSWSMHPKELITFAVPSFYGLWNDPRYAGRIEGASYWGYMPFTQSTHYFGIIPLILALMVRPNRSGFLWGCVGFSVVALFIGLGKWFPVLYLPAYELLPYFSKFRVPSMIYMLLPLSVGILAAWTLDRLVAEPAETTGGRTKPPARFSREEKIGIAFGAALAFLALVVIVMHGRWGWAMRPGEEAYPAQVILALSDVRGKMIASDLLIAAVLTALAVGGVWLTSRGKLKPMVLGVVLVVATLADLWRLDLTFLDIRQPTFAEAPQRKPPEVSIIRRDVSRDLRLAQARGVEADTLFRIAPVTGRSPDGRFSVIPTNEYGFWSLQSVSGYHAAKLRIYDYLQISGGLSQRHVLNMLNTRYLVGPPGIGDSTLAPLNADQPTVYRNREALPRAWWVESVRPAPDRKSALAMVIAPTFDPAREAVVLGREQADRFTKPTQDPRITVWDFHRIEIATENDEPGFLVLSEVYYPHGWRATVDGAETPIYQTDFVLRGIAVPAGEHTVVFTYESKAYRWGKAISYALLPILIVVIVFETWRERRKRLPRRNGGSDSVAAQT